MTTCSRRFLLVAGVAGLVAGPTPASAKTVLDAADETGAFSTFLKAVKTTGLKDTLEGEGPFTIFAPTDDAFTKLSKKVQTSLFDAESPEAKERLKKLLRNHILEGIVVSGELTGRRREALNMAGGLLTVSGTKGYAVGTAKITRTDIIADNGIVHVIDTVQMPK